MLTLARAVRALRRPPAPRCGAHHWHHQSPLTGKMLQPTGWRCCHCRSFTPATAQPPTSDDDTICADLAWSDSDGLELWVAGLRR